MAGDEKVYSLDIYLDLHKGGWGQKPRGTLINFGIIIEAGLKEGHKINSEGGLC